MIIPSKVHIARDEELAVVAERAEMPSWYNYPPRANVPMGYSTQLQTDDANIDDARSAESQSGSHAEPIKLLDCEDTLDDRSTAELAFECVHGVNVGTTYPGREPKSDATAIGPRVFRKDAMVGVTDTMCATGKPCYIFLHVGSNLILLFSLRICVLLVAYVNVYRHHHISASQGSIFLARS